MKPDRITSSQTLIDSANIARRARVKGASRTAEMDGAARLIVAAGASVRVPVPRGNLSQANALVVNLKPLSHFKCALITTLWHTTRSPGMSENDSNVSVLHFHQPRKWTGWTRVVQPAENLVAVGFPDGWKAIGEIELRFSSRYAAVEGRDRPLEIAIGDIEVSYIDKPRGSRMSDEHLFNEALDLDRPDMKPVARWIRRVRPDYSKAVAALASIVRRRRLPDPGPAATNRHYEVPTADDILAGRIMGQALGTGAFDWRINPIGYLEWNHAFNRHGWLQTLTDAVISHKGPARRRYARALDRLVASWIDQCPEPVGHNGGLDPAWETLSVSCRINWPWPEILRAASAAGGEFSDRTLIELLKSFHGHAEHLLNYHGDCNWFISESTAMMVCAAVAPFFKRADLWAARARRRLEAEMKTQVFPDGVQYELSPGYHMMCAGLLARGYQCGVFRGERFSKAYVRRLEAMYDYRLLISRPNGTIPLPNDAGCNATEGPSEPEARMAWAADLLKRPEWRWTAGGGKAPGADSVHFADAGYAVMRSGWRRDDLWAFMDAANFGSAHQHEDKLHVELYAYGSSFLMDAGIQSYQHDPLVEHCRRADAHNTILVDGCGQDRRSSGDYAAFESSVRGRTLWASGEGLDVFAGCYDERFSAIDGGRKNREGFVHERTLVFVKNDYWLILDSMTGPGRHEIEALWHFAPMHLKCDTPSGIFRTNRIGLANMELICRGDWQGGDLSVVTGRDEPPQGFIAIDGEMKPAPCATLLRRGSLPLHGVVAAVPYRSGTASGLTVETREIRSGSTVGTLITVAGAGCDDRVLWRHTGSGSLAADGIRGDGRLTVVRRDDEGAVRYAALCDGRTFKCDTLALKATPGGFKEYVR